MIRASLLLAVMFGVSPRLLERRSAAERHLVWAVAIVLAAAVPVLTTVVPTWQPELARRAIAATLPSFAQSAVASDDVTGDVIVHAGAVDAGYAAIVRLASVVWFCGMALTLIAAFRATHRLAAFTRRARVIGDPSWKALVSELETRLGPVPALRLLESEHASMPATWGWRRPSILLPTAAVEWSESRRRAVLAHELAHVRRGDYVVQLAATIIRAIYWFNPLFWMAHHRLCQESEQACDDVVLSLGTDRHDYATHLFEIARTLSDDRAQALALSMARSSNLERRFAALLSVTSNRRVPSTRVTAAVAALMLVAVLPVAAIGLPVAYATIQIQTGDLPALPGPVAITPTRPSARVVPSADVRAVRDGVRPPEVVEYSTPPLYSDEARSRRIEGTVTLAVRVDTAGRADVLRVVNGLGFGLDANAALAVGHWQFAPATRNGVPVESTAKVDVVFNLENDALNELIANDMATLVGPGVSPPRIVRRIAVERSVDAAPGRAGVVRLDVVLLEDGTPKVVRITRSLDPEADQAAVRAFEQWRFSPAMEGDVPVKVRMNVAVTFHSR
jgi:TonB family protein